MCIMLTVFYISKENQKVLWYSMNLNISSAKEKESQNYIIYFCVIWGYHFKHSITQKVYKIET